MTEADQILGRLNDFYFRVIKPFKFPIRLLGVEATVYVTSLSASGGVSNEYSPYAFYPVITAKGQPPISLERVLINENKLVAKDHLFYENDEMLTYVINKIKRAIDGKFKEKGEKPTSWVDLADFKPVAASLEFGKAVIYEKYRDSDDFLLNQNFYGGLQCYIDRMISTKKETFNIRKEWLPENIIKDVEKLRELAKISRKGLVRKSSDVIKKFLINNMRRDIDLYREMPVDWEIAASVSDERAINHYSSWASKYVKYACGPEIEVGKGENKKTINPRREFCINYPVIADRDVLMRDDVLELIDNLKPIEGVRLFYSEGTVGEGIDFKLTKSILKYFYRKHLSADVFKEIFFLMLSNLPVEWMPELPRKLFSSTYELDDYNELVKYISFTDVAEAETVSKKVAYIKTIDCHVSDYLKKIYKTYIPSRHPAFVSRHTDKTLEALINEFVEKRNFPDTITQRREMKSNYARNLKTFMLEKEKELKFPVTKAWLSEIKKWFYLRYLLTPKIDDVEHRIKNVNDSFSMFTRKVVDPICVLLSDKEDALTCSYFDTKKACAKIFGFDKEVSLPKLLKISMITHEQGDYFSGAGNDPYSLKDSGNYSKIEKSFLTLFERLQKDKIRKEANLTCMVEWMPITLETVTTEDGKFHIMPLMSAQQLVDEGRAMNHCVGWGGYADKSARGRSKIFSIRDDELERVATLEMSYSDNKVSIKQLYGPHDNAVSGEVSRACYWFANQINKGDINVSWDDLNFEKENSKKNSRREHIISYRAGYMPSEEGIRKAMVPWKRFVPKELYEAPFKEWLKFDYVRDSIKSINNQKPEDIERVNSSASFLDYEEIMINGYERAMNNIVGRHQDFVAGYYAQNDEQE